MCDESVNFSTLAPRVLKFGICKQVHAENVYGGPGWTRTNNRIKHRIYSPG